MTTTIATDEIGIVALLRCLYDSVSKTRTFGTIRLICTLFAMALTGHFPLHITYP